MLLLEGKLFEDFGKICEFISISSPSNDFELAWIRNSVLFKNYYIHYSSCQEMEGFTVWASVNSFTLNRYLKEKAYPRYFYEWDEGSNIIVLQCIYRKLLCDSLEDVLLKNLFYEKKFYYKDFNKIEI